MAKERKSTYRVSDPQGVYPDQDVEVPFDLPRGSMRHLSVGVAKSVIVRVLAVEAMYGCPLSEVDPKVVRDMLHAVTIEGPIDVN